MPAPTAATSRHGWDALEGPVSLDQAGPTEVEASQMVQLTRWVLATACVPDRRANHGQSGTVTVRGPLAGLAPNLRSDQRRPADEARQAYEAALRTSWLLYSSGVQQPPRP
jgi:hypothetical protein